MLWTSYYVVRGNSGFSEKLRSYADVVPFFPITSIWIKEEGGYTAFHNDDYIIQVKLIFLAGFRSDSLRYSNQRCHEFVHEVLGNPPFDVSLFDKWWTIERLTEADDFFMALHRISLAELENLKQTGMPLVDDWIAIMIELKRQNKL